MSCLYIKSYEGNRGRETKYIILSSQSRYTHEVLLGELCCNVMGGPGMNNHHDHYFAVNIVSLDLGVIVPVQKLYF